MFELMRDDQTRSGKPTPAPKASLTSVRGLPRDVWNSDGWDNILTDRTIRWPCRFADVSRLLVMCLCCISQILSAQATKQHPEPLPPSPFKEPQKRSKRIRYNSGAWNPIVDLTEIFPGSRNLDHRGVLELNDGAVGVKLPRTLWPKSPSWRSN